MLDFCCCYLNTTSCSLTESSRVTDSHLLNVSGIANVEIYGFLRKMDIVSLQVIFCLLYSLVILRSEDVPICHIDLP